MTHKKKTMKPILQLVENSALWSLKNKQEGGSKQDYDENNSNGKEPSTECLSDQVIFHLWKRMLSIYGYKWASHMGLSTDAKGHLSDAAKTWQQGLSGLGIDQVKIGFDMLISKSCEWPPSLPEFRKLCLSKKMEDIPTSEQCVNVLVSVSGKTGSIKSRYGHPLIFCIASQVDMHILRTVRTVTAIKTIMPIYERLLLKGFPGWPDYALTEQKALKADKRPVDLEKSRSHFASFCEKLEI